MLRDELEAMRRRAGNLRTRDIVQVRERCGYVERTGGKHRVFRKPGRRSISVQTRMTSGTAIGIINRLIDELDDRGEGDGER